MSVKLKAVGDISLGDYLICLGFGVRSSIEKGTDVFCNVKEYLNDADITFGNLESVLSDEGRDEKDPETLYMRGKKEFLPLIKEAGFNVLNIANNHIMQHGGKAFEETVSLLESENICVIGKKNSSSVLTSEFKNRTIQGICFGFLSYNLVPELYCQNKEDIRYATTNLEGILCDVRQCVEKCDHLIVSLHWGLEYMRFPSKEMKEWARAMIDTGVRVILGHHPHVLQGIEQYRDGVIVYSMGNFVFDLVWHKRNQESMILQIDLDKYQIIAVSRQYVEIDNFSYCPRSFPFESIFKRLDKKIHENIRIFAYIYRYRSVLAVLLFKKINFMFWNIFNYSKVFKKYFLIKKILRMKK
jgi:gamma-polyglutamate biosynthesis protein CapA